MKSKVIGTNLWKVESHLLFLEGVIPLPFIVVAAAAVIMSVVPRDPSSCADNPKQLSHAD